MNIRLLTVLLLTVVLSACASFWKGPGYETTREGASSSLVDYLYPGGEIPPTVSATLPYLSLPASVGIAFVPTYGREDISAAEKQQLLETVAEAFRDRDFVQSIQVIPDAYMKSTNGIKGMKQVAALYGVDVLALVSYDQMTFSSERDSALLYWTIIGALVVKGNTNEVQTMIDTAVFDVASAKLLFRAPGTHKGQRNVTLMEKEQDLRKLRSTGFAEATADMIANLDVELQGFKAAVQAGQRAQVEWREGSGGGGLSSLFALLLLLVAGHRFARGR
jgi:rhombotail lipoprotein